MPRYRLLPAASIAALMTAAAMAPGCHLFADVTPCLDGQACPDGLVCDEDLGICANKKAAVPPADPGSCGAPLDLALGGFVEGDTSTSTSIVTKAARCSAGGGDAAETVYGVTVDHDARLRITATPVDAFDLQVYVRRDDCEDPFSEVGCADGFEAGGVEVVTVDVVAGETIAIIVDGFRQVDVGRFQLSMAEVGPAGAACDDATGLVCDTALVCVEGFCAEQAGERCENALRLEGASGQESGDTTGHLDNHLAGPACTISEAIPAGFDTDGPDIAYVISIPVGATFSGTLNAAPDLGIYAQDQCPPPVDGTCLGFADAFGANGVETFTFLNEGSAARELFLFIDSFAVDDFGAWTMDWTLTGP